MEIDYAIIMNMVAEITKPCFVIALIFGITGKLVNFALSMIFNKKVDL